MRYSMKEQTDAKSLLSEQLFVALQAKKALKQPSTNPKPVLFADIVAYVMGKSDNADGVYQAINSDLSNRRIYQQVLNQSRFAVGLREAHAKSTGEIELRRGEGFAIKLKTSKANSQHCYVILVLDDTLLNGNQMSNLLNDPDKAIILHISGEQAHQRLQLPPLFDGKTQLMMMADDERLLMLKDINNELSLC